MKRKKLYAGTLALALSIGAIAPVGGEGFSSLAYAAEADKTESQSDTQSVDNEQTDGGEKSDQNQTDNTSTNNKEEKSENSKITRLKELINEKDDVVKSTRYNNASDSEKNAYTNAIKAGKKPGEDANIDNLIKNIEDAKKNLAGSSYKTHEQRDGLSSTIAIGEKLLTSIKDKSDINKDDKDKLKSEIDAAKATVADVNKSKDEINSSNKNLAQTIDNIIKVYDLDASNSALTYDEIKKITPSDNASYGKAYNNLETLINSVKDFSEKDSYNKLNSDSQVKLTNASKEAAEVFDSVNSSTDQLNEAYSKLNKAYNDALSSIGENGTEVSRLKNEIKKWTKNDPEELSKAGSTAKLSYNNAKAEANRIANKDDATVEELNKALNSLNLARLALAPVETKVIDGENDKSSDNQENTDDNASQSELDQAKVFLKSLVDGSKDIKENDIYKKASDEEKNAYDTALANANKLLNDLEEGKDVSVDDLNQNILKLSGALLNLGYEDDVDYPSDLKELVAESDKFKNTYAYYNKNNSDNEEDKELIKAYNDLIKEADDYLKGGGDNKEKSARLVENINNAKKAILGKISKTEQKLAMYVTDSPVFIESEKFEEASKSENPIIKQATEDFKDLISKAKAHLASDDKTDESMADYINKIENAVDLIENPSDDEEANKYQLNKLVEDAKKVKNHPEYNKLPQQIRDDLSDALKKAKKAESNKDILAAISDLESVFKNKKVQELLKNSIKIDNKETLEELLDLAKKVKEHNEYKNVGFTQRGNLDKAIIAANSALKNGNESDIEISRTGLVNALNQSEIKPIADLIRANAEIDDPSYVKELKDLISLANKVKNHPDYANVSEDTKRWLDDILIDSESYLKNGDKELIQSVTDRLKSHLNHEELRPIVQKIQEAETEEETIDPREIISKIIANDGTLRKSEKYRRAQKSLKEAYNKALEEARDLIKNDEAKEEDLKSASNKLVEAANALDGDKYQARLKALKDEFNSKKYDISDKAKRSELGEKIKALENDDATMDDLLAVEKELKNATAVTGTSQPVQGTTTTTTTRPVTGTTTTTTPVTTTKQVPATVNPGSIVRTGIKSLVGVAGVLVVALGAYALTGKNKDKNDNNKRNKER